MTKRGKTKRAGRGKTHKQKAQKISKYSKKKKKVSRKRSKYSKKKQSVSSFRQEGSGITIDTMELPDSMTNEEQADFFVDKGIEQMRLNLTQAEKYFQIALKLDPDYTLAQEYLDTIFEARLRMAQQLLAIAKNSDLDRDILYRISKSLHNQRTQRR